MIFFVLFSKCVFLQMLGLLGPPQLWQGHLLDYSNTAGSVFFLVVYFYMACIFFPLSAFFKLGSGFAFHD